MKEWIKNVAGQDIKEAYDNIDLQYKTTMDLDEIILEKIRKKDYRVDKQKNTYVVVKKLLIAAAIVFVIFIPVIYLYNTFLHPHRLVLTETLHDVTIKSDHMNLFLSPGTHLKQGYELITGEKSACTLQYAQKSTIAMHEKAEMNIIEFSKNRILLDLASGEIYIKEKQNKGATIHIKTPLATIYAIGTEYSVNHSVNDVKTIVKVFEGIVHIETIPRKEEMIVNAGEEVIIRQDAAPVKRVIRPFKEQEWQINTVYAHSSVKKAVTGFDKSGEMIIAGTEQSLVCFTGDKILWEHITENTYFISKPVIDNNKVYIPSAKSILCFNLFTGIKESNIEIRDTLKSGHNMIQYKDNLYITFASGIYMYNKKTGLINPDPLIPVIDATLPAFYADNIYITSYITNSLDAYNLSGEKVWSVQLNDKSNCSPVVENNVLLSGTKAGTLYKLTLDGMIDKSIQLEESIISIVHGNNRIFFVIASGRKFYGINRHTFDIEMVYYNVNTGMIYNNMVIMGMEDGTIKIVDIESKKEIGLALPYSEVSAFIGYEDSIYAGLKNGDVLKLEHK